MKNGVCGANRKSAGKALDNFLGTQSLDGDEFVPPGGPFYNGYGGLFNSEYPAEKVGKLPVGLALLRRRGDSYLEYAAGKTGNLVTAGAGMDFYLQQPVIALTARGAQIDVQLFSDNNEFLILAAP